MLIVINKMPMQACFSPNPGVNNDMIRDLPGTIRVVECSPTRTYLKLNSSAGGWNLRKDWVIELKQREC